MPTLAVERVLVPHPSSASMLVVDGPRPSLPGWTMEDLELSDSLNEARRTLGLSAPFLRIAAMDGDFRDPEYRTLLEFEPPDTGWQPTAECAWLPFDEVLAGRVDCGPFDETVRRWIGEVSSGSVPTQRPEWERRGSLAVTTAWLGDELRRLGREIRGPVGQLSNWAVSSLLAVDTDAGRVVVKSVPQLFAHEPELTRALALEHSGQVPTVLATHVDRRRLVMEAFGGASLGNEDPSRWSDGLVAMAGIQHQWIGRRSDAERIGVPDRSLEELDAELESIVGDESASPGLAAADRARLVENIPRYHELVTRLGDGPVPETLVHADFHPWNVQRDGDRLVIYDWSDACWSHPFFDVATFTTRTEDATARATMRETYLGAWADHGSPDQLRDLLRWAGPLTELHLAITWRRLHAIFEPDHAFAFADTGVQRHLESALAATEELDASGQN